MQTTTKLRLYNTASRKVEIFSPFNPDEVKIYTCGPTVYSTPHIGNYAAYIYWDLLVRTLKANNYQVKRIINLTDVGHLVSDNDDGEDKLEKGARTTGKTVWEVADHYIKVFQDGFHALNLLPPAKWARATDYIKEDQAIVETLTAKGFTYETSDGVYFDTSRFLHYADFAHLDLDHIKAGARVEFSQEKHNPSDFAIWKFIAPGEKHAMRWDFLGRPGYPGWHLECSTIIHTELGETIDIHTGGIDHIPVHHTNEIAQSEAAFDKRLAKYWLHCNFITINGEKFSKSLGNAYTLEDLATKGFDPLDFKLWILQGHFTSQRDFTFANLEAARARRLNWRNRIALTYQQNVASSNPNLIPDLLENLNDNLNSPEALALIDNTAAISREDWQNIDALLGLNLIASSPNIKQETQALLDNRQIARNNKDYAASDDLRNQILTLGYNVLDTPTGQIWQYAK